MKDPILLIFIIGVIMADLILIYWMMIKPKTLIRSAIIVIAIIIAIVLIHGVFVWNPETAVFHI